MSSQLYRRSVGAVVLACCIGLLAFATMPVGILAGQAEPTAEEVALAADVRERFEVDLRPDGLVLTSTDAEGVTRVVTLGDGVVEVDGAPVSGAELREGFGPGRGPDTARHLSRRGDAPVGVRRRPRYGGRGAGGPGGADRRGGRCRRFRADRGVDAGASEQAAATEPGVTEPGAPSLATAEPAVAAPAAPDNEPTAVAPRRTRTTRGEVVRVGGRSQSSVTRECGAT